MSESEKWCRGDLRWFEEMLDRKKENVKNFFAPILLQKSLKPSLGQHDNTENFSLISSKLKE